MLKCEFHVPISPTPDFLCRIHYLCGSMRLFSGLREDEYRIVVTVGDAQRVDLDALCPWTRDFPLEWRWLPAAKFDRWWYFGTAYERYCYDYDAETVVMLDGDVLVTGRLAEAIDDVRGTDRLAAVPANYSPFYLFREHLEQASPVEWWERICRLAGVALPPFETEHPGWRLMEANGPPHVEQLRMSPPYPNAGVVIASADTMRRIGGHIFSDIDLVNSVSRTSLTGQVALTLAISRLGLTWTPLPLRYNFQNIPWIFDEHPVEHADIRVLHFLDPTQVDRVRDFASYAQVEQVIERPGLHPVNRFFAGRLGTVHRRVIAPR